VLLRRGEEAQREEKLNTDVREGPFQKCVRDKIGFLMGERGKSGQPAG
jgi:hypothetical protein